MPIAWPLRPSVPRVGHAALPRPPLRFPLVGLRLLATTPLMGRVASSALQGLIGAHRGIAHQPATYALQQVRALYLLPGRTCCLWRSANLCNYLPESTCLLVILQPTA
jgi:hypothetical protein